MKKKQIIQKCSACGKEPPEWEMEILWHTITLQDILLAMGDDWGIDGKWNFIRTILEKSEWFKMKWIDYHNIWYKMNLSPYDQSEETLQFIAENLTK